MPVFNNTLLHRALGRAEAMAKAKAGRLAKATTPVVTPRGGDAGGREALAYWPLPCLQLRAQLPRLFTYYADAVAPHGGQNRATGRPSALPHMRLGL